MHTADEDDVEAAVRSDDPLATAVVTAIRDGDTETLARLLQDNPGLATARIESGNESRTLLHMATDWPANFPNRSAIVVLLVEAGANVNARFGGRHAETPLHWAASADDVELLDVLIDAGADIEAPGGVIGGGTAIADAVAFGQWRAAQRLLERGAQVNLWQAAALGLVERVKEHFVAGRAVPAEEVTQAFWLACHGGQLGSAQFLLDQGAELDWIGYDGLTALDAAQRAQADAVTEWLLSRGARSAAEVRRAVEAPPDKS